MLYKIKLLSQGVKVKVIYQLVDCMMGHRRRNHKIHKQLCSIRITCVCK